MRIELKKKKICWLILHRMTKNNELIHILNGLYFNSGNCVSRILTNSTFHIYIRVALSSSNKIIRNIIPNER